MQKVYESNAAKQAAYRARRAARADLACAVSHYVWQEILDAASLHLSSSLHSDRDELLAGIATIQRVLDSSSVHRDLTLSSD